jgi:phosphatidylglycerophosphate synthase
MGNIDTVEKQIPSYLENAFAKLTDRWADRLPESITPNMVTSVGLIVGLLGAVCFALAGMNRWLFIGAIIGVVTHIVADNMDGFLARKWNKSSRAGAYFDIMSDVLVTTFCLIAIGLGGYANINITIFLVPLYGFYYIIALHSIYLVGIFPFPRMGPFEVHASFILVALLNLFFNTVSFPIGPIALTLTDIIMLIGLIIEGIELFILSGKLVTALKKE